MSDFTFNGINASDMGLVVERRPRQYSPRKRITTYQIPGRSGDLHQWDGSWENFTQVYECWFKASPVAGQAHKIKQWLATAPAGARLEDTYDSTVYHLATYIGGADIENIHDRFGRFTIAFDCDPRAYLKSGDSAMNITTSGLLNNPTAFVGTPLIEIDINGNLGGVLRINDYSVNLLFLGLPATTVYVDCDIGEAWYLVDGVEVSCNQVVDSPNWPYIDPGTSRISFSGLGIDAVRVYPRWWTL